MPVDNIAPAEVPLEARQGSPFDHVLQFFEDVDGVTPYSFVGWSFKMQIREGVADSNAPVILTLSSEDSDPAIQFVGDTDGVPDGPGDGTNGMIYLHLPSAITATLRTQKAPKPRQYPITMTFYYDLEGTNVGGETQALAFGSFTVACEVTRAEA